EANLTAMNQLAASDLDAAEATLADARGPAEALLARTPVDLQVAVALGYVEKTEAEVATACGAPDRAVAALSKAAGLFARALKSGSRDVGFSALNGMANVYALSGDYDRAITLGKAVTETEPGYGPGLYDYALALDAKRQRDGADRDLLETLAAAYRRLEALMAEPAQRFSADQLMDVVRKARDVDEALARLT
ncbi:MAG TPA: hypothetical protein VMT68_02585, partial [Caulobacteraceae bacterium]|nr:hypothetical protein [Caulobacteraceae bacterium]